MDVELIRRAPIDMVSVGLSQVFPLRHYHDKLEVLKVWVERKVDAQCRAFKAILVFKETGHLVFHHEDEDISFEDFYMMYMDRVGELRREQGVIY